MWIQGTEEVVNITETPYTNINNASDVSLTTNNSSLLHILWHHLETGRHCHDINLITY